MRAAGLNRAVQSWRASCSALHGLRRYEAHARRLVCGRLVVAAMHTWAWHWREQCDRLRMLAGAVRELQGCRVRSSCMRWRGDARVQRRLRGILEWIQLHLPPRDGLTQALARWRLVNSQFRRLAGIVRGVLWAQAERRGYSTWVAYVHTSVQRRQHQAAAVVAWRVPGLRRAFSSWVERSTDGRALLVAAHVWRRQGVARALRAWTGCAREQRGVRAAVTAWCYFGRRRALSAWADCAAMRLQLQAAARSWRRQGLWRA
eukprot:133489-Prymnesium_polylepis.1